MDVTLNIGVCVRPDGRGTGHNWDRTTLNAARQLFAKPIRLGLEREEIVSSSTRSRYRQGSLARTTWGAKPWSRRRLSQEIPVTWARFRPRVPRIC